MAKVFLISCNLAQEPYPVYPLGMAMVAEAARTHGHEVATFDLLADLANDGGALEQAARAAASHKPDVIGLSLRNIDNVNAAGLVSYSSPLVELVRRLRESCDAPIVLGGSGFSLCPEPILNLAEADYGVVGEGERTFCRLVEQLACGHAPASRILYAESPLAGEEIAAPARESRLAEYYLWEGGMLNLQAKRGCPHHCAYCSYPTLEGRCYRFRSAAAVVDEIEMLRDQYHADYLAFTDSVFNDAAGHYLEIAEEIIRRDIMIPWMAFFRPQRFSPEEVALLKRAGLACVEWGTDCAADATLEAMGKRFTWAEVEQSNRMFQEAGICSTHFIIFGGPGETAQTVREGLANIERLERCVVLAYPGIRILPGTAINQQAIDEGILYPQHELLKAEFYVSPRVNREFLHRSIGESFGSRIDRIYPPGRDQEKVRIFHRMGYRGPIWDLLLGQRPTRTRRGGAPA
jgi:radical SAM superfamily enzyme YgiQ (UPF0313 family)